MEQPKKDLAKKNNEEVAVAEAPKASVIPTKLTLIEVRPIETKKWHGKSGPESFTRPKKLQALVDSVTTKYATGLTEEEIQCLKTEKKVNYDLSDNWNSEVPHPFWDSPMAIVKLENSTMLLDISQPLNYIKYKIMMQSRFVANSMKEYEEGLFPDATHVIFSETEQTAILATKVELKNQCIVEASKMSPERKAQLIMILGDKDVKGQSENFRVVELDKVINKDPEQFLKYAKMDEKETANHALVLEALQKQVLRRDGHKIMFMDASLGSSVEEVTAYLNLEDNQDFKLSILSKIS